MSAWFDPPKPPFISTPPQLVSNMLFLYPHSLESQCPITIFTCFLLGVFGLTIVIPWTPVRHCQPCQQMRQDLFGSTTWRYKQTPLLRQFKLRFLLLYFWLQVRAKVPSHIPCAWVPTWFEPLRAKCYVLQSAPWRRKYKKSPFFLCSVKCTVQTTLKGNSHACSWHSRNPQFRLNECHRQCMLLVVCYCAAHSLGAHRETSVSPQRNVFCVGLAKGLCSSRWRRQSALRGALAAHPPVRFKSK